MNEILFNAFRQIKNQITSEKVISTLLSLHNSVGTVHKLLDDALNEAYQVLSIIGSYNCSGAILEIGAGMGIATACLKKAGFSVYAIEPMTSGFEHLSDLYKRMYVLLDIDDCVFQSTQQLPSGVKYDLIFSFNVLEHVASIEALFQELSHMLKPHGIMVHSCPNYYIPYEPHCNTMLIPFMPQYTQKVCKKMQNDVEMHLTFTTVGMIKRLAKKNNLKVTFKKDVLYSTFKRFEYDTAFAQRQKGLPLLLYQLLKHSKMLWITKHIPVVLQTPMVFELRKQ